MVRPSSRWLVPGLVLLIAACGDGGSGARAKIPKALLIGIDGVRPDALRTASTPNLDALVADGAISYEAQTVVPSFSGPGWSSMLTGVLPAKHGVVTNLFLAPAFDAFPAVTTRLEAARPELVTASVVHWEPINLFILTDPDIAIAVRTDEQVAVQAAALLRDDDPDFVFLHFDDVDAAGHAFGFSPDVPEYLSTIEITDGYVGDVLAALRARPTFGDEAWLILSSTDHGGLRQAHGGITPEELTTYVLVSGDRAARGRIEPAPRIYDVSPTVLESFGVRVDPAWELDGVSVGLRTNSD